MKYVNILYATPTKKDSSKIFLSVMNCDEHGTPLGHSYHVWCDSDTNLKIGVTDTGYIFKTLKGQILK